MLLSDTIEQFIKALLAAQEEPVDIQRNELAAYFRCAPSQINYVLQTRFSVERGYLIESRRGGGGYIRVVRVPQEGLPLAQIITSQLGTQMTQAEGELLLSHLQQRGVICAQTAALLAAAMSEQALKPFPMRDEMRVGMMRQALLALMSPGTGGDA